MIGRSAFPSFPNGEPMPFYAVDCENIPGAVPFPRPGGGRLRDAHGDWLPLYVFRVDTESGRVDRYDVRGDVWRMTLANRPVVLSETYAAPLTYVMGDAADVAAVARAIPVDEFSDPQPPRMAIGSGKTQIGVPRPAETGDGDADRPTICEL